MGAAGAAPVTVSRMTSPGRADPGESVTESGSGCRRIPSAKMKTINRKPGPQPTPAAALYLLDNNAFTSWMTAK